MKTKWYLGETKNYNRFNFIESNREINDNNVKKIEKSILEIGLQVPIVVNDNYEIIEGQHRFIALRRNNLVVPYIISNLASEENIAGLQESKKWTALDFCKSKAAKGDISCSRALEIADDWYAETSKKLSIIRSLEILMDGRGSSSLRSKLQKGKFLINEEYAENIFDAIIVMSEYDMGTTPYGQKITRTLKMLCYDFDGLDLDAIEQMTKNNFIKAYSNENDQYEYLKSKYIKELQ